MAKRTTTTSVRFDESDLARMDKIRDLRGMTLSATNILREALAAYCAQLERRTTVVTTELRKEIREVVRVEIASSLADIIKAIRVQEREEKNAGAMMAQGGLLDAFRFAQDAAKARAAGGKPVAPHKALKRARPKKPA